MDCYPVSAISSCAIFQGHLVDMICGFTSTTFEAVPNESHYVPRESNTKLSATVEAKSAGLTTVDGRRAVGRWRLSQ